MEAKQTPLIELLERIPQDARLVVEHDLFSSSVHPVGRLCREAAAALRAALAEPVQKPVAWLSRDDARLALWEAINKREFGNPTDDKLILDHLHQQGLWIGKYTAPPQRKLAEPVQEAEELKDPAEYDDFAAAIRHNERVTTRRYDSVGPVALETVYETIIHWDEGGGKRSRRELARRIVDLYTAPPQRKPLTEEEIEGINRDLPLLHMQAKRGSVAVVFARAIERAHGITGDKDGPQG